MSAQQVNFVINVTGNADNSVQSITQKVTNLTSQAMKTVNVFQTLSGKIVVFNQLSDMLQRVSADFANVSKSGMDFQQSVADLSSITGITGAELDGLSKKAREFGVTSGLGAVQMAESYKVLASQIEVSTIGIEGLNELQKNTIILAKASGLDMETAAMAMAGTINQFGLQASEASRIINVLAAGSKYGAAEIPDLAQSFKVVGASAAVAGFSIEQTAGALEVLSKNNLKGAEAGTALRNILLKMQTEMGVDFTKTSFSEALTDLKPKLTDATYLSKLFGMENVSAAQFLIKNADAVDEMTQKVTGTNVATEQAAIRTQTYAEKVAVVKARMDELKISVFNTTGAFLPYTQILIEGLAPLSRITPLLSAMPVLYKSVASSVVGLSRYMKLNWILMERSLNSTNLATLGFRKNMLRATFSVIRFGTVGVFQAIKGMGALIISMIAGGATSVKFAAISSASFSAFGLSATTACRAVSVAIMNIPIIGWIAAAVVALIAFTVKMREFGASWTKIIVSAFLGLPAMVALYFYQTSEKVRSIMDGMVSGVKEIFTGLGSFLAEVFEGIWHMIKGVFNPANWFDESFKISDGLDRIKNAAIDYGRAVGEGYNIGKADSMYKSELAGFDIRTGSKGEAWSLAKQKGIPYQTFEKIWQNILIQRKNTVKEDPNIIPGPADIDTTTSPTEALDSITGGGKSMKQIYINIDNLVGVNNNNFTSDQDPADATSFMERLTTALQMIVNDTNYATN